jgi:hypothetical protein
LGQKSFHGSHPKIQSQQNYFIAFDTSRLTKVRKIAVLVPARSGLES